MLSRSPFALIAVTALILSFPMLAQAQSLEGEEEEFQFEEELTVPEFEEEGFEFPGEEGGGEEEGPTNAVPEPSALLLFPIGMALIAGVRRNRR